MMYDYKIEQSNEFSRMYLLCKQVSFDELEEDETKSVQGT